MEIRRGRHTGIQSTAIIAMAFSLSILLNIGCDTIYQTDQVQVAQDTPTAEPTKLLVSTVAPKLINTSEPSPTIARTLTPTSNPSPTNTPKPQLVSSSTANPSPTPYIVRTYPQQGLPDKPSDCNIYNVSAWSDGHYTWELARKQECIPIPTSSTEKSVLESNQIVSFYGHPNSPTMGIVGEYPFHSFAPQVILGKLRKQANAYDELNGEKGVMPAIHLIHTVAQASPGWDGMYRVRMEESMVLEYVKVAKENNMYVFLDLQVGRSSVKDEMNAVLPYLKHANVHIALDPEFSWKPEKEPVSSIGYLTGADINLAQQMIEGYVRENKINRRVVLVVHQFLEDMIRGVDYIQDYPNIDLVIDMDGFGPPAVKKTKYGWYAEHPVAEYGGIKLFYRWDAPLMTEEEVLTLDPNVIIYQ